MGDHGFNLRDRLNPKDQLEYLLFGAVFWMVQIKIVENDLDPFLSSTLEFVSTRFIGWIWWWIHGTHDSAVFTGVTVYDHITARSYNKVSILTRRFSFVSLNHTKRMHVSVAFIQDSIPGKFYGLFTIHFSFHLTVLQTRVA